ncbi:cyclic lactone autoinducer peptide [Paenibacillus hunanensis]|nr:cyclic lactone autoinducer peptide [Paenibacillus hunanensis]MCL9660466.1 cyclic lactone autoinducer peptide [Paenibacillus hunanensis]WPP42887.1 cyclic lactone autoinducer peptide [Paenibacillus hunanensis]
MRLIKNGYSGLATLLSILSLLFVNVSSAAFIYSPEAPEELLKK